MISLRNLLTALGCIGVAFLVTAGESRSPELQPRPVKFSATEMMLDRALAELQQQTGNVVRDRRRGAVNVKVRLPAEGGPFWPMLDAIGKETGIGFNVYQPDGGVALVDTAYRQLATDYRGLFRFAVRRIAVTRDDEAQTHRCEVTLDVAWEPRFHALFVNLEQAQARFEKRSEAVEQDAAEGVAGKRATVITLPIKKAPSRAATRIDSLTGTIQVIGAPKMLEFAFAKPKPGTTATQEGVMVRLLAVHWVPSNKKPTRLSVEVETEYPAGAIAKLDSFQEPELKKLMDSNRVWLTWTDPKTNKPVELEPSGRGTPKHTKTGFLFHFEPRGDVPLPSPNGDVTLRYRTPSRVTAFTVPFKFSALPLP